MVDEFGAPLAAEDVPVMVEYLAAHAGEDNPLVGVPIDLNRATPEALGRLGFLDPAQIRRILRRRARRPFDSLEDLWRLLEMDPHGSRLSRTYLSVR